MSRLTKIALSFVFTLLAFALGNSIVTNLGASSRWLIILGVVIFYIVWWVFRRPSQ
jgi:hypothetical protein